MSEAAAQQPEASADQKLAELAGRKSNAGTVRAIETGGHVASTAIGGALIAKGAVGAFSAGGSSAAACFVAPLAAGMIGVMAGAALAEKLGAADRLVDLLGQPRRAGRGPQPAVIGHKVAHSRAFAGALAGLLAGVAVGAAVGFAVAATVASGGLLAPIAIGAAAGLSGGFVGAMIAGAGAKMANVTGAILSGSPNVFFEGKPVARVTDKVSCSKESAPGAIIEGSTKIFVNGLPLARIGHKISCSAVVQEGCTTIFADDTTGQYGEPDADMSVLEQSILSMAEVGLSLGAIRFRSSKLGKKTLGEPIDPSTGDYVDTRTDFEYPSVLPLRLTRTYSGKEPVEGLLGSRWICNWSPQLVFDRAKRTADLIDADGDGLTFSLGMGEKFTARHLKAPHYRLSGTIESARLFDTRTQQTLVFTMSEDSATGILTAIEDRNGNRIDFRYDKGHLRRVIHSDGVAFSVRTTPEGLIESVAMEGDSIPVVHYRYDDGGRLADVHGRFTGEFHYTYTGEGWLKQWRDSGPTRVEFEYDATGRVIATRTPDGLYNDRFIYSLDERKTEYIDATGAHSVYFFNENNLLIREEDPLGNVTEQTFDGLERRLATTDPLGRVTTYDYDTLGQMVAETDGTGRTTRCSHDRDGILTGIQHPDGSMSVWEYDSRGNVTLAMGTDRVIHRYAYDETGRLVSETAPDGAETKWEYDRRGRLTGCIDPLGHRTAIEQDRWGRILRTTDAAGHPTRYLYEPGPDNLREDLSAVIHPDGGTERYAYDAEGQIALHTGAEGQATKYRHGAFDLLRSITDPAGHGTSLDYDGAARLVRVTNAKGQHWSYGYDAAGRLRHETDWAGRQTAYTRDPLGRVTAKRLPDGSEHRIVWDGHDRVAAIETADSRIGYEYDASDRLIRAATWAPGSDTPETDLTFTYDDRGRLVAETQNGITIDYTRDEAGRCTGRTTPSGATELTFDPAGLLAEYTTNGHAVSFRRNLLGLETERSLRGDDERERFALAQSHDPCGRLREQVAGRLRNLAQPFGTAELSRRYRWDKSSRLVGVDDTIRGSARYTYDPRDQVTGVQRRKGLNPATTERYHYDAIKNLTYTPHRQHHYEGDVVTRIGLTSYRHDSRGRVVEKTHARHGFRPQTWRYRWDDLDRLREVTTPQGETWRYTYDAFGRRVKKECLGKEKSVTYLWQGATLAEEHRTTGTETVIHRWHFEPGTFIPIAKEIVEQGASSIYPIVTDHLGTPKELFDAEGECVWQADHALWGKASVLHQRRKVVNGEETIYGEVDCELRFQNQWEDEESGLYYNLNRYYDPESGQYLSQDPIRLEGGLRTHGYVHDPMQWVDPLGLAGCGGKASDHRYRKANGKIDFYVTPNGQAVPAQFHRYANSKFAPMQDARAGTLPAKRGGTYVSFDKIDDGIVASDKLQIPYRPDYRVSGNSLDIIDKMKIPNGKWGTADYPEPLTKDYKIYGPGKATQVIVDGPIPVDPGTITKL